jgi:2-dehydro-3-deoxyphosphogluconate aldolase / (4S)-4-hydroxy-2-oxoglutarate aldolase
MSSVRMEKQKILKRLTEVGVVAVLRGDSPDKVIRAVEALVEGGIPVAEITMTVPGALKIIERCVSLFGDLLTVGAGSVTDAAVAIEAMDAGSLFVVTPTVKLEVIDACKRRACLVIAGALTPSEILAVWEAGADAVKVFPAQAMGGPAYLRMVHEPLPQIVLAPTGGVTLETLAEYFKAGVPFVGAGGDLVGKAALEAGNTKAIAARAREYIAAVHAARAGQKT